MVPCNVMYLFIYCRTTYRVLCLGWYKTCRGSQGFSTHNLNSWAFFYFVFSCSAWSCYCNVIVLFSSDLVVVFLFIMSYFYCYLMSWSLVITLFHPLSTHLMRLRQLMSYVDGLPYITKLINKGCFQTPHIWWF